MDDLGTQGLHPALYYAAPTGLCRAKMPPMRGLCRAKMPHMRGLRRAKMPPMRGLRRAKMPPMRGLRRAKMPPIRGLCRAKMPPMRARAARMCRICICLLLVLVITVVLQSYLFRARYATVPPFFRFFTTSLEQNSTMGDYMIQQTAMKPRRGDII